MPGTTALPHPACAAELHCSLHHISSEAKYSTDRILSVNKLAVRRQGNLLLCTLLLGNTVINSAISILLADLTTGAIGLVVATFSILIFGAGSGARRHHSPMQGNKPAELLGMLLM